MPQDNDLQLPRLDDAEQHAIGTLDAPVSAKSAADLEQVFDVPVTVSAVLGNSRMPVGDLLKFRPLFEQGKELVVASRQIRGSVNEEDVSLWRPRKWAVWLLSVLAALLWRREGDWVRDVLHGFKGWSRSAFARMKVLDHGLSIDIEMVARAYKLRIPRAEFPTSEIGRAYGATHFKIWPTGKRLLKYLKFELFRRD